MPENPGPAVELLIEWAQRRSAGAARPSPAASSFEVRLDELHRLMTRDPEVRRAVEALRADIRKHGQPTAAARQALVIALTHLAGTDADLAARVADTAAELQPYLRQRGNESRAWPGAGPGEPAGFGAGSGFGGSRPPQGGYDQGYGGSGRTGGLESSPSRGERHEETAEPRGWQEELRTLDQALADGRLSADDYRVRRDEVLSSAISGTPASTEESRSGGDGGPGAVWSGDTDSTQAAAPPPQPQQPPSPSPQPASSTPWGESDLTLWRGSDLPPPGPGDDSGWAQPGPEGPDAEPPRRKRILGPFLRRARTSRAVPRTKRRTDRATTKAPPGPASPSRFLVAHLPGRSPLHADISLVVRISVAPPARSTTATRLERLVVPAGGTNVSLLVQAPAGLKSMTPLEQVLLVPSEGDSEPVRFAFRAHVPGLHHVRVMAFAGGTFLAELEAEVSVESGGPSVDGEPVMATLDGVGARQGEVTLQVRSDGEHTVFQLLSDSCLFEPVLAEALAGDPPAAVERAIATLRQLAIGHGPYSPDLARRWMRETGIGLWAGVVPALIKEQYWQLRDHITSFTIATSHDVIPWELLYPLRPRSDDGFMVEQFPVLRRVFGQQRCPRVTIAPCTYVVSERSPANVRQEIDTLAAVLGVGGVVEGLDELLSLLGSGQCGPLHFACHNSFSTEAGSSISMSGGPFVPGLLNSAAIQRSLAATSPLVFLNACRTAGTAAEYHRMIGWAQQFMAAGAGAFVGTLWPVRSDSAGTFAQTFYSFLRDGEPLGRAALLARRAAVRDGPDPTWLAYTVYGDPHAIAHAV